MPLYKAEVYNREGKCIELKEEALSEGDLIKTLLSKGFSVTSVSEMKERHGLRISFKKSTVKQLSLDDQYLFCMTMSSYLKGGLTVTEVLRLLQKQTKKGTVRPLYTKLRESVEEGRSLASSMRSSGAFRDSLTGMVESGERSASLPEILERAGSLIENEIKLRRKLRSSLTYPVLMLIVGIGVTVFLLTFVVPRLTALVIDSGAELPFVTKVLITVSNGVRMSLIPAAFAIPVLGWLAAKGKLKVNIPLFRDIKENITFAMIFSQVGTLLKSGISLVEALKLTEPLDPVKGRLKTVEDYIRKGYRFSQGLEKEGSFPEELVSVIRVGENGRNLSDSLIRLGAGCWDIAQSSMQRYATLAEPAIILVMGFLVGFVVIAVLLPIFDLSTLASR